MTSLREAELVEALRDLSDAARNSCNAAQHPPLADALFNADLLISAPTPKPETPTRAREVLVKTKEHLATILFALEKVAPHHDWIPRGRQGLEDAKAFLATKPVTDPLQVAGGWQVYDPNQKGPDHFGMPGFHYAEGPGDLRIRTNDRALLDDILARLQLNIDWTQWPAKPSRMEVAAAAYRNGYDAGNPLKPRDDAVDDDKAFSDRWDDDRFNAIMLGYLMGARWVMKNGPGAGLAKAAYDYADKATSPIK